MHLATPQSLLVRFATSHRAAVSVHGAQPLLIPPLPHPQEAHAALQLAQQAGFQLATATIHHLRGDFTAALSCHIAHTQPAHTFAYIQRVLAGRKPAKPAMLARFKAAVRAEMPRLIALDGLAAADAVLRHMDDEQSDKKNSLPPVNWRWVEEGDGYVGRLQPPGQPLGDILASLAGDSELQYRWVHVTAAAVQVGRGPCVHAWLWFSLQPYTDPYMKAGGQTAGPQRRTKTRPRHSTAQHNERPCRPKGRKTKH
jgi:hypothetical protein